MRYQFISATALTDEPLFLGTSTDWGSQTVEEQHQDGRQGVVKQAQPWVLWLPRGTNNSNEPNFDEATNDEHQLRYTWGRLNVLLIYVCISQMRECIRALNDFLPGYDQMEYQEIVKIFDSNDNGRGKVRVL